MAICQVPLSTNTTIENSSLVSQISFENREIPSTCFRERKKKTMFHNYKMVWQKIINENVVGHMYMVLYF